jgi:AcrR family transcriptional regulator
MNKVLLEDEQPLQRLRAELARGSARPGLRARKKAKTRAAIQQHALRLFREQGYAATMVEQIAVAAEISPSTFFRYFPTKEDVVLCDDLDPLLIAAFDAQPPELSLVQAMRGAIHAVFFELPPDEMQQQLERSQLILGVPDLRMRMLDQFAGLVQLVAELVSRRAGRRVDDVAVRAYAGAMMGVLLSALVVGQEDPSADVVAAMDASLAFLEAGLPL